MSDKKTGFIANRARPLKKLVTPVISYGAHRNLWGRVFSTIRRAFLVATGKIPDPSDTDGMSYEKILDIWGVNESNRAAVIRGHYIEFTLFMLLGFYGIYSIYSGLFYESLHYFITTSKIFGGILMMIIALLRSSILMWRLDVLKKESWVSYLNWVKGKN